MEKKSLDVHTRHTHPYSLSHLYIYIKKKRRDWGGHNEGKFWESYLGPQTYSKVIHQQFPSMWIWKKKYCKDKMDPVDHFLYIQKYPRHTYVQKKKKKIKKGPVKKNIKKEK